MSILGSHVRCAAARLRTSRFVRQVAVVAGGTAAAQVITIAVTPVVTRIYGPGAFGVLGVFNALVTGLTPIACLGYHTTIMLPNEEHEARGLLRLSVRIAIGFSLAVAIVVLFAREPLAVAIGFRADPRYLLLVPIGILGASLRIPLEQWLVRRDRFRTLASIAISQSALNAAGKVGIGLLWPTGLSLISVRTGTEALRAVALTLVGREVDGPKEAAAEASSPGKQGLLELGRKYSDFPIFELPTNFVRRVGEAGPTLIVAAFFGPTFAGFYELARRIIKLPSILMQESVRKVYRARAAKNVHRGKSLHSDISRITVGLLLIGFLPYAVVVLFGPAIFAFVFGEEWLMTGRIARWLAVWHLLHVSMSPSFESLKVTRNLPLILRWTTVANVGKIGALVAGAVISGDPIASVAAYAVAAIAADLVLLTVSLRKTI